jgi:hypothetical protein
MKYLKTYPYVFAYGVALPWEVFFSCCLLSILYYEARSPRLLAIVQKSPSPKKGTIFPLDLKFPSFLSKSHYVSLIKAHCHDGRCYLKTHLLI